MSLKILKPKVAGEKKKKKKIQSSSISNGEKTKLLDQQLISSDPSNHSHAPDIGTVTRTHADRAPGFWEWQTLLLLQCSVIRMVDGRARLIAKVLEVTGQCNKRINRGSPVLLSSVFKSL